MGFSPIMDETDRGADLLSQKLLNIFAKSYNEHVDDFFSKAHDSSAVNPYDASEYERVAFKNKNDVQQFVADMQEQGIDVAVTPFKVNNQYMAEIRSVQDDGRRASDIIEDFESRTYVESEQPHTEQVNENYNNQPSQLLDVMVVNHLDTLGRTIHGIGHGLDTVEKFVDQYGQHSNQQIFQTALDEHGNASENLMSVSSRGAQTATVINGDIVVMNGQVVTDEKIRNNVLSQHEERMALARLGTHEGDYTDLAQTTKSHIKEAGVELDNSIKMSWQSGISHAEKVRYNEISDQLNNYSKIIEEFERRNDANPSQNDLQQYNTAKKTLAEFEQDTGIKIEAPHKSNDGLITTASLKTDDAHNTSNFVKSDQLQELNKSFLEKAEEAGYNLVKPNGTFDTQLFKELQKTDVLTNLGYSESTQNIVYSMNANVKQLSKVEVNSEAIMNAMYRQEYVVTTSSLGQRTAKDEPNLFCTWSLGDLEKLSNEFNTEKIARNSEFDKMSEAFSPAQKKQVEDFVTYYNEKHPDSPIERGDLLNIAEGGEALNHEFEMYRIKSSIVSSDFSTEEREALIRELHSSGTKLEALQNADVAYNMGLAVFDRTASPSAQFNKTDINAIAASAIDSHIEKTIRENETWNKEVYTSARLQGQNEVLKQKLATLSENKKEILIKTFGSETKAKRFLIASADEKSKMLREYNLTASQMEAVYSISNQLAFTQKDKEAIKKIVSEKTAFAFTKEKERIKKLFDNPPNDVIAAKKKEIISYAMRHNNTLIAGVRFDEAEFLKKNFNEQAFLKEYALKNLSDDAITMGIFLNSKEKTSVAWRNKVVGEEKSRLLKAEKDRIILEQREKYAQRFSEKAKNEFSKESNFVLNGLNTKGINNSLTDRSSLVQDIQRSKLFAGTKIASGALTPDKLLEMNAIFLRKANELGYNFITVTGQFNIKMLQRLTPEQLEQFGISPAVRNALVRVNAKGAFGDMSLAKKTALYAQKGGKAVGLFMRHDGESWGDVQELLKYSRQYYGYGKTTVVTVRRLSRMRISDLKKLASKKGRAELKEKWNAPFEKKQKKVKPKEVKAKPLNKFQKAKQNLYSKFQKAKLKVTQLKQKTLTARMGRLVGALKKRLAETALAKALAAASKALSGLITQFLLYYFGGGVLLGFFVQIVALVSVLIIALVETITGWVDALNPFTVSTYKDTVAWNLYEELYNHEASWIAQIEGMDDIAYEKMLELRYTADKLTLKDYVENSNDGNGIVTLECVLDNNGKVVGLAINPFWKDDVVTNTWNEEYLVSIDKYDGKKTFDISTNLNDVNINDLWEDESYIRTGVENGHTSNIKDILAMVDVMYEMEVTDSDDDSIKSVLGADPDLLNWNEGCEAVSNFFATIGNAFSQFFSFGDPNWSPPFEIKNETFGYDAVLNYATTLFEASHGKYVYLSVSFCKEDVLTNADGTEVNLVNGVEFDICPNPYQSSFPIKLDASNNPRPYLEGQDGTIYYLDENHFDVKITMDDVLPSEEQKLCLTDEFALWVGESLDENDTNYEPILDFVKDHSSCWKRQTTNNSTLTAYAYGDDWDNGSANAQNAAKRVAKANLEAKLNDVYADYWEIRDENTFVLHEYKTVSPINYSYSDSEYWLDGDWWYEYEAYCTLLHTTTTYKRQCAGHTFEYCGGHVNVHTQGNVFSATNEQLTLADMYEKGFEPKAMYEDVDYSGRGYSYSIDDTYGEIKGKIIKDEVDYSTITTAVNSGGYHSPMEDPYQGTYSTYWGGLNLIVEGGGWGTGLNNSNVYIKEGMLEFCRDIFDVDMCIEKGCLLFGYKDFRKYEGWTADNMVLAINRMAMDWYDAYGFDISMEIGDRNYRLAFDDIDLLCEGLKVTYGNNFDATREELIREALSWVGRGHYSELHRASGSYFDSDKGHSFLTMVCDSQVGWYQRVGNDGQPISELYELSFIGSCTAGTGVDLASYLTSSYNEAPLLWSSFHGGTQPTSGLTNCYPSDIITHNAYDIKAHGNQLDVTFSSEIDANLIKNYHLAEQSVIYVGTFTDDAIQKMADIIKDKVEDENYEEFVTEDANGKAIKILLVTGQEITAGVPICIDLNEMGAYNGIFLRTTGDGTLGIDAYFEKYKVNDGNTPTNSDYQIARTAIGTTYYWLYHPDNRTNVYQLVY